MHDAYNYFVKADSVKLVDVNGAFPELKTAVIDETWDLDEDKIKDLLNSELLTEMTNTTFKAEFKPKGENGLKDLLAQLTESKTLTATGRAAQKSVYDYAYRDQYYDPGFPPPRPLLIQEQDFDSYSQYKTYELSDVDEKALALRISEDTGQNVNTVLHSVQRARKDGMLQLNVQVPNDRYIRGSAHPANTKMHPWEEFFSTFTYKPGFSFAYSYDINTDRHQVCARMQVEDIDDHGHFVPVQCYFTLPEWTYEEEAQMFTRNKIIMGFEQHEMDEWMLFNGKRVFNPHDPKNASLQIAGL